MIEMLRRLLLAAGIATAIVLAMYTPPLLLRAEYVDFAREYAAYGTGSWPRDLAESLIEKPDTLEKYIEGKVDTRRVDVSGSAYADFLAALKRAASPGAEASAGAPLDALPFRRGTGSSFEAFLRPEDPPLNALAESFQRSRDSGWLNTYVAVATPAGTEFFEVLLVTEPRDSRAPADMVHPLGRYAWWALALGLGAYLLLPRSSRRRPDTVTFDPVGSVLPLDGLGTLWLAVCVFVPLWATDTMAEALGEEIGLTVFFGLLALLALPAFVSAARKAAFSIAVDSGRLRFGRPLAGRRELPIGEIARVEPLMKSGVKTGVVIHPQTGNPITLDWTDLERFEVLLGALR